MKLIRVLVVSLSALTVCGEEYLPISENYAKRTQQREVKWNGENTLFHANKIHARFGRKESELSFQLDDKNYIEENATTPIGQAISFYFQAEEHEKPSSVRMYFIRPDEDWRKEEDELQYAWKLSQSWMPNDNHGSGWMFWNVEGYVDSAIQVPHDNAVFECDYLEFNYKPRMSDQIQGVFVAHDVRIGAYLSDKYSEKDLVSYNPCGSRGDTTCQVIDGLVSCIPKNKRHETVLAVGGGFAIVCCLVGVLIYFLRRDVERRSTRYTTVSADLEAAVEE